MMIVMKEGRRRPRWTPSCKARRVGGCERARVAGRARHRDRRDRRPRARGQPRARGHPGVDHLVPIIKPYKLAWLQFRQEQRSVLEIDGRRIGGDHFATIAGPCTVESREVMLDAARTVRDAGAQLLRGGAYKPRTSPYSFQGLGGGACGCFRRRRTRPACRSSPS